MHAVSPAAASRGRSHTGAPSTEAAVASSSVLHGVDVLNSSTEPCSATEVYVVTPLADTGVDTLVAKLHSFHDDALSAAHVSVNVVGCPSGRVDDAMSTALPTTLSGASIIAESTAVDATLLNISVGAGTPSTIKSSYGVTNAIASRNANQIAMSFIPPLWKTLNPVAPLQKLCMSTLYIFPPGSCECGPSVP